MVEFWMRFGETFEQKNTKTVIFGKFREISVFPAVYQGCITKNIFWEYFLKRSMRWGSNYVSTKILFFVNSALVWDERKTDTDFYRNINVFYS